MADAINQPFADAFNQPAPDEQDAAEVMVAKCWKAQQEYTMPIAYEVVRKESMPS